MFSCMCKKLNSKINFIIKIIIKKKVSEEALFFLVLSILEKDKYKEQDSSMSHA